MVTEISVVYAAYNEEENLRDTIQRSIEALRPRFQRFEILLVNDCSKDATPAIADELAAQYPELTVLHNPQSLGFTGSLLKAFRHVRYAWVVYNAVDYPFDLCDLDKMIPLLDNADIVVAARTGRPGYTTYRLMLSHANILLLHFFFNLRLRDYNFIQIFPASFLRQVEVVSRSAGFVPPEMMFRANDMGMRIVEVPITYHPRLKGKATAGNIKIVVRSLKELLGFWWLRVRGKTKPREIWKRSE